MLDLHELRELMAYEIITKLYRYQDLRHLLFSDQETANYH